MSQFDNQTRDTIVSFKEEGEEILGQLVGGSKGREVVLITGMGGLGKTTLAKRLYEEEVVRRHFDIRAWCTVSQEYDYKDSIRKLYKEVCNSTMLQVDDGVAGRLRERLMGRRYLVVLDDIWSAEAWEELNRVFPSCDNGSRIVLTSRQENVVVLGDKSCHHLPFFKGNESWELLQMKLFGEEGKECPEELANIGKKICNKCGGLPLVVGLVAGLLKRSERKEEAWSGFLNDLSSQSELRYKIRRNEAIELSSYKQLPRRLQLCLLYFAAYLLSLIAGLLKRIERKEKAWSGFLDDLSSHLEPRYQIRSNEAIELSYKHLPRHLQSCLLYFAAYPEDKPVEVSRLIRLWIAQGFVRTTDDEKAMTTDAEDVAEDYLNNLVSSNLVMVFEREYDFV